jgi:hypothetical protein
MKKKGKVMFWVAGIFMLLSLGEIIYFRVKYNLFPTNFVIGMAAFTIFFEYFIYYRIFSYDKIQKVKLNEGRQLMKLHMGTYLTISIFLFSMGIALLLYSLPEFYATGYQMTIFITSIVIFIITIFVWNSFIIRYYNLEKIYQLKNETNRP